MYNFNITRFSFLREKIIACMKPIIIMGAAFLLVCLDKEEWERKPPKWLLISILIRWKIPHIFVYFILMVVFPTVRFASTVRIEIKRRNKISITNYYYSNIAICYQYNQHSSISTENTRILCWLCKLRLIKYNSIIFWFSLRIIQLWNGIISQRMYKEKGNRKTETMNKHTNRTPKMESWIVGMCELRMANERKKVKIMEIWWNCVTFDHKED